MTPGNGELLLTGATGFVGMEVLARYLERGERPIIALVRARDDEDAGARIDHVLTNLFGESGSSYRERVDAVAADLARPGLTLERSRRRELAARTSVIVHGAASVSFALPLECAREVNLGGTRHLLDFATLASENGGLERYAHMSTAYVAGTHAGCFCESDMDLGQGFHNSYEQSKFEAEQLVRERDGLPFTVVRPSIVVGDRRSGWTAAFNVLYWPLRALARGLLEAVPALPSAPVDVVSIDYVADAIYELCECDGGIGDTYHLTAGEKASTIGEIAMLASEYFGRAAPRLLSPDEFAATQNGSHTHGAVEQARAYFPYFSIRTVFGDAASRARLAPSGIEVSPLADYLGRLLDFATASRWGKRPIARADALAAV